MLDAALMQLPAELMTVVPTARLLRQALPTTVRATAGVWQCRDREWSECVCEWQSLALQRVLPNRTTILKQGQDKLICVWNDERTEVRSVVVKATAARRFDWRLNPRRRWDAEGGIKGVRSFF